MRIRILPVVPLIALSLTGCALLMRPITQGTVSRFEQGSVVVRVTEGELPELGTFTLHDAGRYNGWGMEDGTNADMDGSRAMFESDLGWQLYLERFGRDDLVDGDVHLRYKPTDGEPTYAFSCTSADLVTTDERFSGTLDCWKIIPSEPPPLRIELSVDLEP